MLEVCGSNASQHAIGGGNTCTRTLICEWQYRLTIAEQMLGQPHPEIPFCWCHSVKIEPIPAEAIGYGGEILLPNAQAIEYDLARLTVEYSTDFSLANQWPTSITKPSIRVGTSLQITIQASGEFMRFPARAARWADNTAGDPSKPVPEDDSPAGRLLVRQGEFALVWSYVDDPPTSRFDAMMGCTNSDTFLGQPVGTLLFNGYEISESTKAEIADPGCWTVKTTLLLRKIQIGAVAVGWNYEYRGEDGWQPVYVFDGSSWVPRYTPTPFAGMFI